MKDLAPQITRKRLVIEATFAIAFDAATVKAFLLQLAEALDLRTYGEPIIHSPAGDGKSENQGFDAFVPLIDSGIALYIWTNARFLSCVLYTCKDFSTRKATEFTQSFCAATELVFQEF